jgi:hypothetical protein
MGRDGGGKGVGVGEIEGGRDFSSYYSTLYPSPLLSSHNVSAIRLEIGDGSRKYFRFHFANIWWKSSQGKLSQLV